MHLLALGLAYARKDITPALAFLLLERSRQEIVETIFGYRPTGLDRILRHLPDKVLAAHTYRKLIDLLNDGATATFLHHSKAITEAKLIGLHNLPPVAAPAGNHDDVRPSRRPRRAWSTDCDFSPRGRAYHSNRWRPRSAPSVSPVKLRRKSGLSSRRCRYRPRYRQWKLDRFGELIAPLNFARWPKRGETVLPSVCPASTMAPMPSIFRTAGKSFAWWLDTGGWVGCLAQAKGPYNSDVEADRLTQIHAAFSDVGVFPAADIETIRNILLCRDWSPQHALYPRAFHEEMGLF